MKCPIDGETLLMTNRSGIEIDYCPKCRGIWLDRGELDKIVERESSFSESSHDTSLDQNHKHNKQNHKKKPMSFIGDLLDF